MDVISQASSSSSVSLDSMARYVSRFLVHMRVLAYVDSAGSCHDKEYLATNEPTSTVLSLLLQTASVAFL